MVFLGWLNTATMNNGRVSHTASVLTNEKVLVTGGYDLSSFLNSAELYNPSTGTWAVTGSMNNAREQQAASVQMNRNVLVAGGISNSLLNSAELY
ncbi:unnamed protein product [Rotaria sp. Silwood1]|nr:unnamed protein product [Rotaria sp. Silwood1]CAF1652384.1 unnamed protein product [Rotaria sp. Silwood1]CAF4907006.1 unnamed protein product [Rotaria sp. Silwood1]